MIYGNIAFSHMKNYNINYGTDYLKSERKKEIRKEDQSTPETQYSKRARQTPFVYYIESFTISRQSFFYKIP